MARALTLFPALVLGLVLTAGEARADLARVETGSPAPDFSAMGSDGRTHALSEFAGKIVVLEWTGPVCPYTELKYRRGLMQAIQKRALARAPSGCPSIHHRQGEPATLRQAPRGPV